MYKGIKNVVLNIAWIIAIVQNVIAGTASATVTQKLVAASAIGVWRMVVRKKLCSTCNLLCRTKNFMNQLAEGSATKLCLFYLAHSDQKTRCRHCNRYLLDGNETNLCSIRYPVFHEECHVIGCKEPWYAIIYCKKHTEVKHRCRNCRTRGLADGSRTLCSTCIGALVCGHCNKSFSSTQNLRYHVDNNVCIPATEATCLVERERIIIPNKECNQAFVGGGDAKLCANYRHNLFACYECEKELADGDILYYCSRCNFMLYKIYYYYQFYILCTIIDRQLDNYI